MSLLYPVEAVLLGSSLKSGRQDGGGLTWTITPNNTTRPATAARGFMAGITKKKVWAQSENIFIITSFAVHIRDFSDYYFYNYYGQKIYSTETTLGY